MMQMRAWTILLSTIVSIYSGLLSASGLAQISSESHERPKSFEIASVKPAAPDAPFRSDHDLFSQGAWDGDGLRATAIFNVYMDFAYDITDAVQGRAIWDHLPLWAKTEKYEIQAKASPDVTRDEMRTMMQVLLAERFALRIHTEVRERDVMTVSLRHPGSTGPQLKPHSENQPCVSDPNRPLQVPAPEHGTFAARYCGVTSWIVDGQRHLQIIDETMEEIATTLSSESQYGGFVTPHAGADATGMAGRYDLDLQYATSEDDDNNSGGPTFQSALEKQAGLKMIEHKMPISVIVIDHLERPSAN